MVIYSVFGLAASQLTYVVAIGYSNAGTATVIEFLGPILIVLFVCITARRLPNTPNFLQLSLPSSERLSCNARQHRFLGDFNSSPELGPRKCDWFRLVHPYSRQAHSPLRERISRCLRIHHRRHHLGTHRTGMDFSITWDFMSILAMAGLVIIGTTFAFSLFLQGVGDIGPVRASLISCLQPISAAFFSFLLVGTHFTLLDISGMALILAGVIIVSLKDLISLKRSNNHERKRLRQRSGRH